MGMTLKIPEKTQPAVGKYFLKYLRFEHIVLCWTLLIVSDCNLTPCEKSRFYAKKSDFFQMQREARKLLGYFVLLVILIRLDKNADILFSAEHALLFVLFLLVIVLSVLLFTVSDYAFGIFNLFFRVS
jgi:hypothetical protein